MLSTTHTLSCPICGQPATIRVHTVRHRRDAPASTSAAHVSYLCRRRCVLAPDQMRELSGVDAAC